MAYSFPQITREIIYRPKQDERQVNTFPGSSSQQTNYKPISVQAAEPTIVIKEPARKQISQEIPMVTRVLTKSSSEGQPQQTGQATQAKKPSTGSAGTAIAGAGAGYAIQEALAPGATQAATTFGTSAPMSTLSGESVLVSPAGEIVGSAATPVAEAASMGSSWGALGAGTVGSSTAGAVAGVTASVAGAIVAAHEIPKVTQAWAEGDMGGGIAHGAAAGAGAGASIGAFFGPQGSAIGAGIGAVTGAIAGAIGASRTGKDKDQLNRDAVRDALQGEGVIDNDYNLTLADGTKYDIGKDGHARNFDDSGYAYQIAKNNPFSVQAAGWAGAFTTVLAGGNKKLASDFGAYFANAAMSNASDMETVRANILGFMDKTGTTRQQLEEGLSSLKQSGAITEQEYASHMNSLNSLFSGQGYVTMSWAEAVAARGGTPTDQDSTQVPTPSPSAPDRQTGPLINDIDPVKVPDDVMLKIRNVYSVIQKNPIATVAANAPGLGSGLAQQIVQQQNMQPPVQQMVPPQTNELPTRATPYIFP